MTTDINMVQMAFMMALRMLIRSPLMFGMAIYMAFTINKKLSLVFLAIAPIMFGLILLIGSFAHKRFEKMFKKYDKLNNSIQETLIGIKNKFGKNAILKGLNLQEGATAKDRNEQIGGHKA